MRIWALGWKKTGSRAGSYRGKNLQIGNSCAETRENGVQELDPRGVVKRQGGKGGKPVWKECDGHTRSQRC